jgi:chromate transporter
MSVGILRAGLLGGLAAWIGFTLPSAVALVLAAFAINQVGPAAADWLQGLKLVAVAVVAQAVWGMARTLTPDRLRASIAIGGAAMTFVLPATLAQLGVITISGLIGWRFLVGPTPQPGRRVHVPIPRWLAHVAWALLLGLLVALPLARAFTHVQAIALLDSFYRSGALVFGGGHVVLPLLQAEVVQPGWVSDEEFLTGYGLAQAVPGPLFTFSAFLGTVMGPSPNGVVGAAIALTGIFLPSMLLTIGALPYWTTLRARSDAQATLRGVNAGVVGLLLAALYDPVWTSAVQRPSDFALALAAFGLLAVWRVPPWIVVLTTTLTAGLLAHAIGTRI